MTKNKSGLQKKGYHAWYALLLLVLVYMFSFMDRQVLSILSEDIKGHFGIDDAKLGFLYGTTFAIFYALFGIPLGRLADQWSRTKIIGIGLFAWSLLTVSSGFATSFGQLATARIGVAIGESAASPAAHSLLSDLFPRGQRALALALYNIGSYVGMGLSLVAGGWISVRWAGAYANGDAPFGLAGWQVTLVITGAAGMLLVPFLFSLREPVHGSSEEWPQPPRSDAKAHRFLVDLAAIIPPFTLWSAARFPGGLRSNLAILLLAAMSAATLSWLTGDKAQWIGLGVGLYGISSWIQILAYSDEETYRAIFGNRTVLLILSGFGLMAFFTYGIGFWSAPYALRHFSMGQDVVGLYLGVPALVASICGLLAGAWLSDKWSASDRRARIYVCMLTIALPAPVAAIMLAVEDFWAFVILNAVVQFLYSGFSGSAAAACQEMVPQHMRGTIGACFLLSTTIVGLALGPYWIGKISMMSGSLRLGLYASLIPLFVSVTLLWIASKRMGKDIVLPAKLTDQAYGR